VVMVMISVSVVVSALTFCAVAPLSLEAGTIGASSTESVVGSGGEVDSGALSPKSQQHSTSHGQFLMGTIGHTWYKVPSPE
jgi:hypothetical protein